MAIGDAWGLANVGCPTFSGLRGESSRFPADEGAAKTPESDPPGASMEQRTAAHRNNMAKQVKRFVVILWFPYKN